MALAIDPLIRLDGISKIFHTEEVETHALSRVSLDIRAGEFVAVCGPSGCGKTTLLRVVAGFARPDRGTVSVAGRLVEGSGKHVPPERLYPCTNCGMVPLPRAVARGKLHALGDGARIVRREIAG